MPTELNNKPLRATRVPINWHPGLPIFASEKFLKATGDDYGWIGGIDDSGKLRCILPYTVIRKAIFRMVRFRTEPIPLGEELEVGEEKSFLNDTMHFFRSNKADMVFPATANAIFRTFPDGAKLAPYGTYVIDLNQPEDMIWSNIYRDFREKIRRATKIRIQIRSGIEYLDTAYALIVKTLDRSSLSFKSFNDFKHIVLSFGENVKVFIAEYEGNAQGCMVIPFSEYCAFGLYGGSLSKPAKGSMHLLQWEAIRQFRALGVKRYNSMGVRINPEKGSKQEGIKNFKMRFGGRLVQGYMWKYSFHPIKFAAYSLAVRLLRGGDVVDQESHKLKNV